MGGCWPREEGLQNTGLKGEGRGKGSEEKRRWLGGEIQEGFVTEGECKEVDRGGVPRGGLQHKTAEAGKGRTSLETGLTCRDTWAAMAGGRGGSVRRGRL